MAAGVETQVVALHPGGTAWLDFPVRSKTRSPVVLDRVTVSRPGEVIGMKLNGAFMNEVALGGSSVAFSAPEIGRRGSVSVRVSAPSITEETELAVRVYYI